MLYISELPFSEINPEQILCSLQNILVTLVRSSSFVRNTRFYQFVFRFTPSLSDLSVTLSLSFMSDGNSKLHTFFSSPKTNGINQGFKSNMFGYSASRSNKKCLKCDVQSVRVCYIIQAKYYELFYPSHFLHLLALFWNTATVIRYKGLGKTISSLGFG